MTEISEPQPPEAGGSESARLRILSMSPDGLAGSSIEIVLRRRLEELAQAIRDKDLERVLSFYDAGVVAFDVRPPLDARGVSAYRGNFERWFASFEGPLSFEFKDLCVVPGETTAFCHYLALISGARSADHRTGYWVRGTTCFERRDGTWLVTHEHLSQPMAMQVR